jgi:hypothetical protein
VSDREPAHQRQRAAAKQPVSSPDPASCVTHDDADVMAKREAERTRKSVLLNQTEQFAMQGFKVVKDASESAFAALDVVEIPKSDLTKALLGMAGAALLGASSGAAAAWVFAGLGKALADKTGKFISDSLVGAYKKSFATHDAQAARSLDDIRQAFKQTFDVQVLAAERRFIAQWPTLHATLDLLSVDQLAALNGLSGQVDDAGVYQEMRQQTFVAWTNFLARVKHGQMRRWDHWAEHGSHDALPTPSAQPAPKNGVPDPTLGNIRPNPNAEMLANTQRPMQSDPFGVLEIFVFGTDERSMRIVDRPGYRMRLDNVGPKVREEFRTMGKVRDLRVNKVVHLCSYKVGNVRVNPPSSVASILITADGYVRASNWAEFMKVHFRPKDDGPFWDPNGFGDCMEQLIYGKETADCHLDHRSRQREVSAFAAAAQELPLSYLEP